MKTSSYRNLTIVLVAGSIWGLVEATAGVALRGSCARLLTGSILLGTMMFFIAATYSGTKKGYALLALPFIATLFKLYSALIMSKPVISGGIINPIYAFFTETIAFVAILILLTPRFRERIGGQVLLGGGAALGAVLLFPAVGFFTGIPACVLPGTRLPLALWGAPVAIGISMVTVPAGFAVGRLLAGLKSKSSVPSPAPALAFCSLVFALTLWGIFLLYR